ncbi:AAA family ATPase [Breoghania sp.]|uniref:AAA family ATPase n=1 Tax=Breoghania sp. TaxID=2065378 RepID=UPI002AA5F709|nr:AAA family ATPase [Breoghania sp.]
MKISYALQNLRSLTCTPDIELRPITILVGRNSAGKSTFLRSLALLRQSLEAKSSAPILWYGDYVDFGDFSSAVSHRNLEKEVSFRFVAEDFSVRSKEPDYLYFYREPSYFSSRRSAREYSRICLTISLGEQQGRTVRRTIELEDISHNIFLEAVFEKYGRIAEKFLVNGVDLGELLPSHSVFFDSSDIFSSGTLTALTRSENRSMRRVVNPISSFSSYISGLLKPYVNGRIRSDNIEYEARRILHNPVLNAEILIDRSNNARTVSFKNLYKNLADGRFPDLLHKLNIACAMNYTLQAIGDSGEFFRQFFVKTTYLGPARARSERYYRFQELEVAEISPDGRNLPMFLASLPQGQLRAFSDWVEVLFGFGVGIQKSEGHISIQLKREDLDVNAADTGYGVSQLLPVLAQIWWASKANIGRGGVMQSGPALHPITMEQPELHLHPAHQAQLADALLNALPSSDESSPISPVFVVETHSETLINRLGELIEEKKLSEKDVQIVIFSGDQEPGSTKIETSSYDSEGVLTSWPFGFFSY